MRPGDRVQVMETCIWPERAGCCGTVVAPPTNGIYPQPPKWEVLVLLDDDPFGATSTNDGCTWTCVFSRKEVRPLVASA